MHLTRRGGGGAESPMLVKLLEGVCATDPRAPGFPDRLEGQVAVPLLDGADPQRMP